MSKLCDKIRANLDRLINHHMATGGAKPKKIVVYSKHWDALTKEKRAIRFDGTYRGVTLEPHEI